MPSGDKEIERRNKKGKRADKQTGKSEVLLGLRLSSAAERPGCTRSWYAFRLLETYRTRGRNGAQTKGVDELWTVDVRVVMSEKKRVTNSRLPP